MKKTNQGQTLIEVLVTVLLIAVGVIALIRFQNYLTYQSNLTAKKADAITLATSQIETLRSFEVLNNTSGYTSYQGIVSGNNNTTLNNTTYSMTWTVTPNTSPVYKTINVSVSWVDRNSITHTIQLVTDVAGIEPANSASIM